MPRLWIGTCKLNGIASYAYLRCVGELIADHTITSVTELLPWAPANELRTDTQNLPMAA